MYISQIIGLLFLALGTWFDINNKEIPTVLIAGAGLLAVSVNIICQYQLLDSIFLGVALGGMLLMIGFLSRESVGYGDGAGIAIMGILIGGLKTMQLLVIAVLASGVYALGKFIIGDKTGRNDTIPFYPFIMAGLIGAFLI